MITHKANVISTTNILILSGNKTEPITHHDDGAAEIPHSKKNDKLMEVASSLIPFLNDYGLAEGLIEHGKISTEIMFNPEKVFIKIFIREIKLSEENTKKLQSYALMLLNSLHLEEDFFIAAYNDEKAIQSVDQEDEKFVKLHKAIEGYGKSPFHIEGLVDREPVQIKGDLIKLSDNFKPTPKRYEDKFFKLTGVNWGASYFIASQLLFDNASSLGKPEYLYFEKMEFFKTVTTAVYNKKEYFKITIQERVDISETKCISFIESLEEVDLEQIAAMKSQQASSEQNSLDLSV